MYSSVIFVLCGILYRRSMSYNVPRSELYHSSVFHTDIIEFKINCINTTNDRHRSSCTFTPYTEHIGLSKLSLDIVLLKLLLQRIAINRSCLSYY